MSIGNAISVAISGLTANARSVATIANNVANVTTPDFAARKTVTTSVVTQASQGGGVRSHIRPSVELSAPSLEMSVELADEFSRLTQAQAAYRYNAEIIRRGSEMIREAFSNKA